MTFLTGILRSIVSRTKLESNKHSDAMHVVTRQFSLVTNHLIYRKLAPQKRAGQHLFRQARLFTVIPPEPTREAASHEPEKTTTPIEEDLSGVFLPRKELQKKEADLLELETVGREG
jgi:hypothetical protein